VDRTYARFLADLDRTDPFVDRFIPMEISPLSLYFLMEYNEAPQTPRCSELRAIASEGVSVGRNTVGTSRNSSPINTAAYLTNRA